MHELQDFWLPYCLPSPLSSPRGAEFRCQTSKMRRNAAIFFAQKRGPRRRRNTSSFVTAVSSHNSCLRGARKLCFCRTSSAEVHYSHFCGGVLLAEMQMAARRSRSSQRQGGSGANPHATNGGGSPNYLGTTSRDPATNISIGASFPIRKLK